MNIIDEIYKELYNSHFHKGSELEPLISLPEAIIIIDKILENYINIVENRLPKWNKVKEKLPDINQTVWLTNGKDWVTLGCLVNYDGKLMWSCNNYVYVYSKDYQTAINYNIDFSEIIYWYPVPDLPYTK